jgi:hypothetical protein
MVLKPLPHNCRLWPLMLPIELELEQLTMSLLGSGVAAACIIWIAMPRLRPRDVYN